MLLFSVRLPWEVFGVILADTFDGYKTLEERLIAEFLKCCAFPLSAQVLNKVNGGIVRWLERRHPRKYVIPRFAKFAPYFSAYLIAYGFARTANTWNL